MSITPSDKSGASNGGNSLSLRGGKPNESTALAPIKPELDVDRLAHLELPFRMFPDTNQGREAKFQVVIKQSVLNDIYDHGRSSPDIEVCGVFVGNLYRDTMGPFLYIEGNIRGNGASSQTAQVTFTSETWTHIHEEMEAKYPERRMVGWYHTHPSFGIFLSDMDVFIHRHFFGEPSQVAFVYDPASTEEGLFVWRDSGLVSEPFVVEINAERPEQMPVAPSIDRSALPANAPTAVTELLSRIRAVERRQRWTTAAMALTVILAVGWPVVLLRVAPMLFGTDAATSDGSSSDAAQPTAHKSALPWPYSVELPDSKTTPAAQPMRGPKQLPAATVPATSPTAAEMIKELTTKPLGL